MSKVILSKVATTGLNLWKSTREVLQWFQETLNKQASSLVNFDIDFYPSITEHLLLRAIDFAKQYSKRNLFFIRKSLGYTDIQQNNEVQAMTPKIAAQSMKKKRSATITQADVLKEQYSALKLE